MTTLRELRKADRVVCVCVYVCVPLIHTHTHTHTHSTNTIIIYYLKFDKFPLSEIDARNLLKVKHTMHSKVVTTGPPEPQLKCKYPFPTVAM